MHTHNEQANKIPSGNDNSDTILDNMQQNRSDNSSRGRTAANNEQKDNINDMSLLTRYGRAIRKPDKLVYY